MGKIRIGKLIRIRRYPVKSMAGEDVNSIYVHNTGVNGDRIYAFHDPKSIRRSLPYITVRENNQMVMMKAKIDEENSAEQPYRHDYVPNVKVELDGEEISVHDNRLLRHVAETQGPNHQNLTLELQKSGIHDTKPISIVSMESIQKLGEQSGLGTLNPLRFRSNFYVEWDNNEAFYEQQLVYKSIQIGSEVILSIAQANIRCTIINVDPLTGEKNRSVLSTVSKLHGTKFGIYGDVRSTGKVFVDDGIFLLE